MLRLSQTGSIYCQEIFLSYSLLSLWLLWLSVSQLWNCKMVQLLCKQAMSVYSSSSLKSSKAFCKSSKQKTISKLIYRKEDGWGKQKEDFLLILTGSNHTKVCSWDLKRSSRNVGIRFQNLRPQFSWAKMLPVCLTCVKKLHNPWVLSEADCPYCNYLVWADRSPQMNTGDPNTCSQALHIIFSVKNWTGIKSHGH